MDAPEETLDSIVFPDLRVFQARRGYRFSLDSLLLAGSLTELPRGPVLDAGCGAGVIAFLLARRFPRATVIGIELQAALAARAARGARLNDLGSRVRIVRGDLAASPGFLSPGAFGTIVCNPPYRLPGTGRLAADPERAVARHGLALTLDALLGTVGRALHPDGLFLLSWIPERREELLDALPRHDLRAASIRPVRSRPAEDPYLLLVACAAARPSSATRLLGPLDVRGGAGYSPAIAALLRNGVLPPPWTLPSRPDSSRMEGHAARV